MNPTRSDFAPNRDWRISGAALKRVLAELNIKRPVKIQWMNPRTEDNGVVMGDQSTHPRLGHRVRIARDVCHSVTVENLLHELKHCAQRDRDPLGATVAYTMADIATGSYEDNPFEVDARKFASERLHAYMDLVVG